MKYFLRGLVVCPALFILTATLCMFVVITLFTFTASPFYALSFGILEPKTSGMDAGVAMLGSLSVLVSCAVFSGLLLWYRRLRIYLGSVTPWIAAAVIEFCLTLLDLLTLHYNNASPQPTLSALATGKLQLLVLLPILAGLAYVVFRPAHRNS